MTSAARPLPATSHPWAPQTARITNIISETPGVITLELRREGNSPTTGFRFLPGQFNMLYAPGFGEAAISISSNPQRHEAISHTVRAVGNVTRALARLKPGDQIALRGPFGSAWPVEQCRGHDVIIASGGLGLAPLRPALYHIMNHRDDYGRVRLLHGARTPADLLYASEYAAWNQSRIETEITVDIGDKDWPGQIGVVPALVSRLPIAAGTTRLLTCGPEIMMRFVVFEALERGLAPENVYLSLERNMNCALGFCGHCQLGPAFVCKDGPVFAYQHLEPYLYLEEY